MHNYICALHAESTTSSLSPSLRLGLPRPLEAMGVPPRTKKTSDILEFIEDKYWRETACNVFIHGGMCTRMLLCADSFDIRKEGSAATGRTKNPRRLPHQFGRLQAGVNIALCLSLFCILLRGVCGAPSAGWKNNTGQGPALGEELTSSKHNPTVKVHRGGGLDLVESPPKSEENRGMWTRRRGSEAVVPSSPDGWSFKHRRAVHAPEKNFRTLISEISTEPFLTAFNDLDSAVTAEATLWAEHKDDTTTVNDSTKAYQTTTTPGWERDFGISFALPSDLATNGNATLVLTKVWDGNADGWICSEHRLVITRLSNANYQYGRSPSSETTDIVEATIGEALQTYTVDVSNLVYGKGLTGQVHFLVREKNKDCLSWFYAPNEYKGITLQLQNELTTTTTTTTATITVSTYYSSLSNVTLTSTDDSEGVSSTTLWILVGSAGGVILLLVLMIAFARGGRGQQEAPTVPSVSPGGMAPPYAMQGAPATAAYGGPGVWPASYPNPQMQGPAMGGPRPSVGWAGTGAPQYGMGPAPYR